ncbi:MAG: pilus assembly protein PilX [gamma proteobacterium symbiont of Bathyaustriella thionipta]|nr:pilus assembly protein PilX [gamma proteobacterium symbiont of Bathyaustriella thionipta]MCU7956102.1 pilus assembly protein PilX [gamma proteobacterium symbiont of Bathyaustriella thionipta]MCU7967564.1 pilus assembly protein PilX [gamma proteobacterium symbiont of Bathyaustriella thionipta]
MLKTRTLKKQNGAVLMVSLMFLLIMTILGVSSMQTTVMEEKMAGNNNDYNRALQSSEAGLRAGETWIQNQAAAPAPVGDGNTGVWTVNGPYLDGDDSASEWWEQTSKNAAWWVANGVEYTAIIDKQVLEDIRGIQTNPYYINEYLTKIKDNLNVGLQADTTGRTLYRITSRGTGGNDLTRVLLQTTYSKRF